MKKLKPIKCPKCHGTNVGTLDILEGIALVNGVNKDGTFDYVGFTQVIWEGQERQYDAHGRVLMACASNACGHTWKRPKGKEDK